MCRIAATVGPTPVPLSAVLYDPPRSLSELAAEPREQHAGRINVDGTGVVWFEEGDPTPLRYRTDLPPWGDQTLVELAPRLRSRVVLGAVRSTTPGLPQGVSFVHPFVADGLAGTHNGYIEGFRPRVARALLAEVGDDSFPLLDGVTDSAVLFLLALDAWRAGADLVQAARQATDITAKVCAAAEVSATLTLVLADAGGVAAVNAALGRPANSLHAHADLDGRRWLASEPLVPDEGWEPVAASGTALLTPTALEIG